MTHKNALFHLKRARKAGLPPGTLIHTGERKMEHARLSRMVYNSETLDEATGITVEAALAPVNPGKVAWINIDGLHDTDLIGRVGHPFQIHPLVMEDIVNTEQRPKAEDSGDALFVVFKMLTWNADQSVLDAEQVSLLVTADTVISFQEKPGDVFEGVRERLRGSKGRIRGAGTDYLAYALMDAVVDGYFGLLERVGDEIEALEDEVLAQPAPATLQRLHAVKRRLLYLRKAIWPLREAIGHLERSESPVIQHATRAYFRDLYDHAVQIIDMLETMRDMNTGLFDMYLSSVSNRMNEVMKVLTLIATIFIPITFIAGIYGMNFEWMPELKWRFGYPLVWLVILLISGGMLRYFKRKKWF